MTIYKSPWGPVENLPEENIFSYIWSNPSGVSDDATALVYAPTGQEVSRKQLRESSQRLAHGLRHKLHLEVGSTVLVFSPNSIHYHKLLTACECAGIVVSTANAAYTRSELVHQLHDSGASLVFAHPSVVKVVYEAVKELGWSDDQRRDRIVFAVDRAEGGSEVAGFACLDDVAGKELLEPERIRDPKSTTALLPYSSGTTSAAKGVEITHHNMTSVLNCIGPFKLTSKDIMLACLPFNHIYGLTKLVHWPILIGMPCIIMPKFELEPYCANIQKYKATAVLLVPPVALLLAREPIVDKYDLSSLKLVVSGAAPMGAGLEAELSKRLPNAAVRQAYGLSETSPTAHFTPIERAAPGSIGQLVPNMDGRIVDPTTGKDAEVGKEGELWLRGPNIMKGYHNKPEATAETIVEGGWLRTGDIARVEDDLFYITDRIKELIKYKGFQVAPADLEGLLISSPKIRDAGVIGVYSEKDASELPRAYVVPVDPKAARKDPKAFEKEIQAFVAKNVAPHKKLRGGVIIIDEVPKSASGKILRRVLKDQAKADAANSGTKRESKL